MVLPVVLLLFQLELTFKAGEVVYIYGDMDDDGFYVGEMAGRQGLVPSNFLEPAPPGVPPVPPPHHHHGDPRDDPRGGDPHRRDRSREYGDPRGSHERRDGRGDPRDPRDPRDMRGDPRDHRDPRDPRDPRDHPDRRGSREPRDRDPRDPRDSRERDRSRDHSDHRDRGRDPREHRDRSREHDARDPRDPRDRGRDPSDHRSDRERRGDRDHDSRERDRSRRDSREREHHQNQPTAPGATSAYSQYPSKVSTNLSNEHRGSNQAGRRSQSRDAVAVGSENPPQQSSNQASAMPEDEKVAQVRKPQPQQRPKAASLAGRQPAQART